MSKFIFIKEDDYENKEKITVETDAIALDDVLECLQRFLTASGFGIKGQLTIEGE